MQPIFKDGVITVGKYTETKQDHRDLTADVYSVPKTYRASGYFIGYYAQGEAKQVPASREYKFIGSVEVPASEEAILEQAKLSKIDFLDKLYTSCTVLLESTYPESERASWGIQSQEAFLFNQDPENSTPWLDSAAESREVTREEMADLISAMDAQYRTKHGKLTGARQLLRNKIHAAVDMEELQEIDIQETLVTIKEDLV